MERGSIAVLGWGSLVWDQGDLALRSRWYKDGPELPVEFARISRDRRLTLVIHPGVRLVRTLHAESAYTSLSEARKNLRDREGTNDQNIGYLDLRSGEGHSQLLSEGQLVEIRLWAVSKGYTAVIWTDLKSNFEEKEGKSLSYESICIYIESLGQKEYNRVRDYIQNAPSDVMTGYRQALLEFVLPHRSNALLPLPEIGDDAERGEGWLVTEADLVVRGRPLAMGESYMHGLSPGQIRERFGKQVLVDGRRAYAWITNARYSVYIFIDFIDEHPVMKGGGDPMPVFRTKHFEIREPGILEWGGGKPMRIEWAESNLE